LSEENQETGRTILQKAINVLIAFAIVLFLIITFAFSFSQTKTFRNMLRNELISLVESSTDATMQIGSLKGSFFTSIKLNDVLIKAIQKDTLIRAENLEIHLSPLQILLQKIYIREISLWNVDFNLRQYKNGAWNLTSLIGEADTTESKEPVTFPFIVQINDLNADNLNFRLQSNENWNSFKEYTSVNLNDLQIHRLKLNAKMIADLVEKPDVQLVISKLAFDPNFQFFHLKSLAGAFQITDKVSQISHLELNTDSSHIVLNSKLEGKNFLDPTDKKNFFELPLNFELKAEPLAFTDVATFIESANILKGHVDFDFNAKGTINNLVLNKLDLNYLHTDMKLKGSLKHLSDPNLFKANLELQSNETHYNDFLAMLPALQLPKYENIYLKNYKLNFDGAPLDFKTIFEGEFNDASVKFDAGLNFTASVPEYDIAFTTGNLDLFPFTKMHTNLNSKAALKGKGFKPENMFNTYELSLLRSNVDRYEIDSLEISGKAAERIIDVSFFSVINYARFNLEGKFDFNSPKEPAFNLGARVNNLNIASFIQDQQYSSALNFGFIANGKNFNIDSLTGNIALQFRESELNTNIFEGYKISLNLDRNGDFRQISLLSDFFDFNINGNFLLSDVIELLTYQSKQISKIIRDKIAELNPLQLNTAELLADTSVVKSDVYKKNIEFEFGYEFKNLDLLSSLLNEDKIGISAEGSGSVSNDSTNFSINTEINVDHFFMSTDSNTVYISDLNTNLNFSRDNRVNTFDKLFGAVSISSQRISSGTNLNNVTADLIFNQSKFFYNLSAEVDTFASGQIEGDVAIKPDERIITVKNLLVNYKQLDWQLKSPASVIVYNDSLSLNNFVLKNDSTEISLAGLLYSDKPMNLQVEAKKIPLSMLTYLITEKRDDALNGSGFFQSNITGTLEKPVFNINASMNDINLEGYKFGNLMLYSAYSNNNIQIDFRFLDTTYNFNKPYLSVFGNIPFHLGLGKSDIDTSKKIDISMISDGFNLAALGELIPTIKNQKGNMISNVKLYGTFDKINYAGKVEFEKCSFTSKFNNLDYRFQGKIKLNKSSILLDSLMIANKNGVQKGILNGNGYVNLAGFKLEDILIKLNGDLTVYSDKSQSVSPEFYGDLFIKTDGDLIYSYQKENSRFTGKIVLVETNMTLNFTSGGYNASDANLIYEIIEDSSRKNIQDEKYRRIISEREIKSRENLKKGISNFDISLAIQIQNTATLKIILSPAFNQKLTVIAEGGLNYESRNNVSKAQGEFTLLNGSKMDFFKTLDATGSIRFENYLTDPFMDITATYNADYIDPKIENPAPEPVAVKIKIKSSLSELGGNLASNKDNIQIYRGQRNISNNSPDMRYSAIDAISFIIIGKFPEDFTLGDRQALSSSVTSNAVNSFLGQALTALVNSKVGDVINDIQLSNAGQNTRFNVSGKIENFRYTIGGTQEIFQNLTKSNIRVEYLFNRNFLIRLERKEPIVQTSGLEEKINEFGLKYVFVF
jgi:hypothetical protein